jgi:DNA ligase (NAD+)
MPKESFKQINLEREEEGGSLFANPRNAAAGTIRQLDTQIVSKRGLQVFCYHLLNPLKYGVETQKRTLEFFTEIGLPVETHFFNSTDVSGVIEFWKEWIDKRHTLPFEIDGVVVKVNEFENHEILGYTTHSPRWAIAFKFPSEKKESIIENIRFSVGRTGVITPVAEIRPVHLGGTIVKNASLHNFDYLTQKDIRVNDHVYVEKAGDIIPQVVSVIPEKRTGKEIPIGIPEKCPVCGGEIGKINAAEVAVRCLNPVCPAKIKRSIEIFVSRSGMEIEGMGEKIIQSLVENGLIKNVSDIYKLKEEQLIPLPRMGQKSAKNLVKQVEESKKKGLSSLLSGLGIPLVGVKTAKEIAVHFLNMENLQKATVEDLLKIEGVGEEIAFSIIKFLNREEIKYMIKELDKMGIMMEEKLDTISEKLKGKTFVITGTLPNFSREEIKEIIEKNGGKETSSVSKKTSYVIAGENPGSKLQKAKEFEVKVISEAEFFNLIESGSGE